MTLRTWAMYNRSRVILVVLLTLYYMEIASALILCVINSDPKYLPAVTLQISQFSVCELGHSPLTQWWARAVTILRMIHGAVLCMLSSVQFLRMSLQMHRATSQWQLNQCMNLLVREGVLYFIAFFLLNSINLLTGLGFLSPEGWPKILYLPAKLVPAFTLTPRFIISMRELYACSAQRGYNGSKIDTETGFGFSGGPGNVPTVTTIAFVDAVESFNSEDMEDVLPLAEVGNSKTEFV